ncbi:MAG: GIY-YIG nuclease family protein, partial [Gammaproteobacteria bacterium]
MDKRSFVYMLASGPFGTLYVGVTSDLVRRVYQHKGDFVEGFTKKYRVHDLVWYEVHSDINEAIAREKQLKFWHRRWKTELVTRVNPVWRDLYANIAGSCWRVMG